MKVIFVLFYVFFILAFSPFEGLCKRQNEVKNETIQIVSENESIKIAVNSEKHMYLIVKCINLSDKPSIVRTSSFHKGKELDNSLQGPLSFRTFSLEKKNSASTKTFLCKGKDILYIQVKAGTISVQLVKVKK